MHCELLWIVFFLDNGFNLPADGGLLPLLFFFFFFFFPNLFPPSLLMAGCVFPPLSPQDVILMELAGLGEARCGWEPGLG